MPRPALLALVAAALSAASLPAQSAPDIRGIWEGPYQSEMVPPGNLKLSIARSATGTWEVTLEIFAEQPPPAGPVRDFKQEGDKLSWVQDVAEMSCVSTATVAGSVLKGSAECWQNGAVVVTASFLLEKRKP